MQKSAEVLAKGKRNGKRILSDTELWALKRVRIPRLADNLVSGMVK